MVGKECALYRHFDAAADNRLAGEPRVTEHKRSK